MAGSNHIEPVSPLVFNTLKSNLQTNKAACTTHFFFSFTLRSLLTALCYFAGASNFTAASGCLRELVELDDKDEPRRFLDSHCCAVT